MNDELLPHQTVASVRSSVVLDRLKQGSPLPLGNLRTADAGSRRRLARGLLGVDGRTPLPSYCSAVGRIIAAYSSSEQAEKILFSAPLLKLTPLTATDPKRIRALVSEARLRGYAVVEDEFALGGTGIAAPILDPECRIVGALNVGCVSSRFSGKREMIVERLLRDAETISVLIHQ